MERIHSQAHASRMSGYSPRTVFLFLRTTPVKTSRILAHPCSGLAGIAVAPKTEVLAQPAIEQCRIRIELLTLLLLLEKLQGESRSKLRPPVCILVLGGLILAMPRPHSPLMGLPILQDDTVPPRASLTQSARLVLDVVCSLSRLILIGAPVRVEIGMDHQLCPAIL
jgi:hypothetical protein